LDTLPFESCAGTMKLVVTMKDGLNVPGGERQVCVKKSLQWMTTVWRKNCTRSCWNRAKPRVSEFTNEATISP